MSKCGNTDWFVYLVFETIEYKTLLSIFPALNLLSTLSRSFFRAPVWLSDIGFYFKLGFWIIPWLCNRNFQPKWGGYGVGEARWDCVLGERSPVNTFPSPALQSLFQKVSYAAFIWASFLWWPIIILFSSGISFIYIKSSVFICITSDSFIHIALFET